MTFEEKYNKLKETFDSVIKESKKEAEEAEAIARTKRIEYNKLVDYANEQLNYITKPDTATGGE